MTQNEQRTKMFLFPGVMNTTFQLRPLKQMIERSFPYFDVELRKWGTCLGWVLNLQAYQRNLQMVRAIAGEVSAYRKQHPNDIIHVAGYSAGGGMAALTVSALPEGITINRLILIAPAISTEFPVVSNLLPRVSEFVVNYASPFDVQISLGTRIFGNIDRTFVRGAGSAGFNSEHPNLVQVKWHLGMLRYLHFGTHTSYLSPLWQRRYLLPSIDPALNAASLKAMITSERGVTHEVQ